MRRKWAELREEQNRRWLQRTAATRIMCQSHTEESVGWNKGYHGIMAYTYAYTRMQRKEMWVEVRSKQAEVWFDIRIADVPAR